MAKYYPTEDAYLIVQLPNERLRGIIRRVVTEDAVIVEIMSIPLSRTHTYQRGDYVACRRKDTALGDVWETVAEQRISIEKVTKKEKALVKTPKTKKKFKEGISAKKLDKKAVEKKGKKK